MISLVHGEDIRHWYHEDNHSRTVRDGGLHWSSMKHAHMNGYFGLYVSNPNINLMVKTTVDADGVTRLLGRSLVWHASTGETFFDHIYADEDSMWEMLRYGFANDFKYLPMTPRHIEVEVEEVNFETYPYVDTMSYMYNGDGTWFLSNRANFVYEPVYQLSSHKGHIFLAEPPKPREHVPLELLP